MNHGISGSTTGTGKNDADGSANARGVWNGVTRFEAEVLGVGSPSWDAGDGIARVQAFAPTANDFVYVSIGTNDLLYGITPLTTVANLRWMADRWIAAGLPASHFMLTTLPPATLEGYAGEIPAVNDGIRQLATQRGLTLIDLGARVSADGGSTWRSDTLHIGDGVHYREPVKAWLAEQIAAIARNTP